MILRNRVDPFGAIHAVPARGLFTGNRGVIHDPDTRTLLRRRWTTRAWIICDCGFEGRKRAVFGRNAPSGAAGWTNLFFVDEVTALAAGHRPCFLCRREKARDFIARFGEVASIREPKVVQLDARLHAERLASGGAPRPLAGDDLEHLPDGAMIAIGMDAYAIRDGRALRWSFAGYGGPVAASRLGKEPAPHLLTPATTLEVLKAGYRPAWADG